LNEQREASSYGPVYFSEVAMHKLALAVIGFFASAGITAVGCAHDRYAAYDDDDGYYATGANVDDGAYYEDQGTVGYFGPHPVPDHLGGGFCEIDGVHVHDFGPSDEQMQFFVMPDGDLVFTRAPTSC